MEKSISPVAIIRSTTLLCLLLQVMLVFSAYAQRRDSSGGREDELPNRLLQADVLTGRSEMRTIVPRERLCFDKVIKVKQITSRGPSEGCLFINTTTGLIAHSSIKPGAIGTCDIKPEAEDFTLFVMTLSGNTYHYFNVKKKQGIEHHVSTLNSQQHVYQFTSGGANATLHKKTERKSYCDDKIKAWAYRADGRPETWYLFGKNSPAQLLMTPKKFLGNYGVGYHYSDKGLFIIMELESPSFGSKILDIRDESICFDPSGFEVFEESFATKATSSIQRSRERLARELTRLKPDEPCTAIKKSSIQYQQQALDRQEENLRRSTQGHLGQSTAAQQARLDMMNYDDQIELLILDTQHKICRTQDQLSRQTRNSSSQQRYQQKLTCLNEALSVQKATREQLKRVDSEYEGQPGKIMEQKARIFLQGMKTCD